MRKKVGIIGMGNIAGRLKERLEALGWSVAFQFNRREYFYGGGGYGWDGQETASQRAEHFLELRPNLVFLTLSTKDNGEDACAYIKTYCGSGIPVVTCEKGALSHFDLRQYLALVGYSAAFGGGTHMLGYVHTRRPNGHPVDIDGVFNGTLNYVFHQVAEGNNTLADACVDAKNLHITEPGADDPLSIINGELRDKVQKICLLHNTELSDAEIITPADFGPVGLSEEDVGLLASSASSYRMMAMLSNHRTIPAGPFFKQGWGIKVRNWDIRFGFRNIFNDSELDWLPGGKSNGICITEGKLGSGGKYTLLGPGAGLEPTTTAMLNDAHRLLQYRP